MAKGKDHYCKTKDNISGMGNEAAGFPVVKTD